ncbi:hypothetical protein cypCar_00046675 [Cyprinus carpio]|nr:hypothetical protein cypCar_00046675 [Cyprinus carpio]
MDIHLCLHRYWLLIRIIRYTNLNTIRTFSPRVKTWFQNRRMKHKKQLRKTQDDQKNPNDVDRSLENTSESEMPEKSTDGKNGMSPDRYTLDDNEDDVDIEDDICSPEHLL